MPSMSICVTRSKRPSWERGIQRQSHAIGRIAAAGELHDQMTPVPCRQDRVDHPVPPAGALRARLRFDGHDETGGFAVDERQGQAAFAAVEPFPRSGREDLFPPERYGGGIDGLLVGHASVPFRRRVLRETRIAFERYAVNGAAEPGPAVAPRKTSRSVPHSTTSPSPSARRTAGPRAGPVRQVDFGIDRAEPDGLGHSGPANAQTGLAATGIDGVATAFDDDPRLAVARSGSCKCPSRCRSWSDRCPPQACFRRRCRRGVRSRAPPSAACHCPTRRGRSRHRRP